MANKSTYLLRVTMAFDASIATQAASQMADQLFRMCWIESKSQSMAAEAARHLYEARRILDEMDEVLKKEFMESE